VTVNQRGTASDASFETSALLSGAQTASISGADVNSPDALADFIKQDITVWKEVADQSKGGAAATVARS
jgi:hypothetical protein